jgi:hypothetical protein
MRIQIDQIPRTPTPCPVENCVYRDDNGICDEPRINKGNSDAKCFRMSNKALLVILGLRK